MVEETSAAARQAAVEKAAAERPQLLGQGSRQFREAMETSETARQSLLRELAARDKIAALDAGWRLSRRSWQTPSPRGEIAREATEAKSA